MRFTILTLLLCMTQSVWAGALSANPLLGDYAWYEQARAELAAGDFANATRDFQSILTQTPESRFVDDAHDGLIDTAIAAQQWNAAAAHIADAARVMNAPGTARYLDERRAELALAKGDVADARARYLALYASSHYPDEAHRAKLGIQHLLTRFGVDLWHELTVAQRQQIAQGMLTRGFATEASWFLDLPGAGQSINAQSLAEIHFRARRYARAARVLGALWNAGDHNIELAQTYATALARSDHADDAIAVQRQITTLATDPAVIATAKYKVAFLLTDSGHYDEAVIAWPAWLADPHRARGGEGEAQWQMAWAEYRQQHWDAALAQLSTQHSARAEYWRARILQCAGRNAEARALLNQVAREFAGSYYGALASARLRGKSKSLFVLEHSGGKSKQHAHVSWDGAMSAKAQALLKIGRWEDAVEEMDYAAQCAGRSAIAFAARHHAALTQYSQRFGLDPHLVEGVMQQESALRTDAVSPVGAIGLLQLMPRTAERVAKNIGESDFQVRELFRPVPNLRLGIAYLHDLLQRYHGSLAHMLASYNAGEQAVDRWLRMRADHDIEEFIETIPFTETRQYVMKILSRYW